MGGCYRDDDCGSGYSSRSSFAWAKDLRSFKNSKKLDELLEAYKSYCIEGNTKGFIPELAKVMGIEEITHIPHEFEGVEYEVKFDITPIGEGKEPGVQQYLDAFDFPVGFNTKAARFLKDPVNTVTEGVNNFFGGALDERLVVIEKMGKIYLKEKGLVVPTDLGIPYENVVIKRTEERYEASFDKVLEKVNSILATPGEAYRGKIRKEKGDAFLLDTVDGRIYSMSFTRSHLIKPGETEESDIQRQMEFEYAGYIPGFKGFEQNSERQIVGHMVDLAKHVFRLYGCDSENTCLADGWNMLVKPTTERKYDFIVSRSGTDIDIPFSLPMMLNSYAEK